MASNMYRQGDVLLVQIDQLPEGAERHQDEKEQDRIVLAYGEVTGHAHAIAIADADLFVRGGDAFLAVGAKGASLVHEEHAAIKLDPGYYQVIRQREYVPQSWRTVAD